MTCDIAQADAVKDANLAMNKNDLSSAIKILQDAADAGDNAAKGLLSSYLHSFPSPFRDEKRACKIALEAAEAGDITAKVTMSECLVFPKDGSKADYNRAREYARQAWKEGSPAGGFMLYLVFSQDPAFNYIQEGKEDQAKYTNLARTPVAERVEQTEALNGLGSAIKSGHGVAMKTTIAFLSESSAPSNIERLLTVKNILKNDIKTLPEKLQNLIKLAEFTKTIGNTHLSPTAINNIYKQILVAVPFSISQTDRANCDISQFKLTNLSTEPIKNATYLPTEQPLNNTYLIAGTWNEIWTFVGCDKSIALNIQFTADGWSGVKFNLKQSPAK